MYNDYVIYNTPAGKKEEAKEEEEKMEGEMG
jgi:hypothetical protein